MTQKLHCPNLDVVVVSTSAKAVAATVRALEQQTYPAHLLKIYVVCADLVAALELGDGVAFIAAEPNTSTGVWRNLALKSGKGELVAFLDQGALPSPTWAERAVEQFQDASVGGCQGVFDYSYKDPITHILAAGSLFTSNSKLWEQTLEARYSPYPWISAKNCVYRRSALEIAGPFGELPHFDDVDLGWRVVLSGFKLVAAPDALVRYEDHTPAFVYIKEHYRLGQAAVQMARKYRLRSANTVYGGNLSKRLPNSVCRDCFKTGVKASNSASAAASDSVVDPSSYAESRARFRRRFRWTDKKDFRLAPDMVYWQCGNRGAIVVHATKEKRVKLAGTAEFIFWQLVRGTNRLDTIAALAAHREICEADAVTEVDEFVDHLLFEELLERIQTGPGITAQQVEGELAR